MKHESFNMNTARAHDMALSAPTLAPNVFDNTPAQGAPPPHPSAWLGWGAPVLAVYQCGRIFICIDKCQTVQGQKVDKDGEILVKRERGETGRHTRGPKMGQHDRFSIRSS